MQRKKKKIKQYLPWVLAGVIIIGMLIGIYLLNKSCNEEPLREIGTPIHYPLYKDYEEDYQGREVFIKPPVDFPGEPIEMPEFSELPEISPYNPEIPSFEPNRPSDHLIPPELR